MDRIDPYAKATISEQPVRQSPSSQSSPARTAAIIALIQQTRALSSLPLSEDDELKLAVIAWQDALHEVPDHLLVPAWRKATRDHNWSKPFPVMAILPAYQQLIAEDRAKRQSTPHYRADGTVACRWCLDTGYVPVATYCPTGNEWYTPVYPCECAATPISQRAAVNIRADWQRNDRGQWIPGDSSTSPRCQCGFCRQRRHH